MNNYIDETEFEPDDELLEIKKSYDVNLEEAEEIRDLKNELGIDEDDAYMV